LQRIKPFEIVGDNPESVVVFEVVSAFPTDWKRVSFCNGIPGPLTMD
jgi:hypothetical protein